MKRTRTLTSKGDYSGVKITIEFIGNFVTRDDTSRAMDCLVDGVTKAICDAPLTGAAYPHQVKIR